MKELEKIENFCLKWGLAALILAIPLYPKFPLFKVPGTYVAVRAEDFFIAFLGIVFIFSFVRQYKNFLRDRINQALILFFTVGLVSVLSAIFITQTVATYISFFHWLRRIEYVIPFFIAASYVRKASQVRFFLEVLLVAGLGVFIYGLGQMYLGFPVISTQNEEFAKGLALRWAPGVRLHSTFGGHYDLASFLVMVLSFGYVYLFAFKNNVVKLLALGSIVTSYWLLLMSGSRISVAAYFLSTILVFLLLKKYSALLIALAISAVMVFTVGDLAAKYRYTFETTGVRVINAIKIRLQPQKIKGAALDIVQAVAPLRKLPPQQTSTPVKEDRSTSIRLDVEWPRALNAFYKNPLLGTGYSSISLATDNDYLRLLGEVGLLGFLAFFLVLARIVQRLWIYISKTKEYTLGKLYVIGSLGMTVGMLVAATFIDVFEASKVAILFWTLIGMVIGLTSSAEETT